jgi:hypothetical protein
LDLSRNISDGVIGLWTGFVHRILFKNSLSDGSVIVPTEKVKLVALTVAKAVLPVAVQANRQVLGDFIGAICAAVETKEPELLKPAFAILERILSENLSFERYIGLFAKCVDIAIELPIGENFLFLLFGVVSKRPQRHVEVVRKLLIFSQRNVPLAIEVCSMASGNATACELTKPFAPKILEHFAAAILADFRNFRDSKVLELPNFLSSFLFLESISKTVINPNVLGSFIVIVSKSRPNHQPPFEAIAHIIGLFGPALDRDILELFLEIEGDSLFLTDLVSLVKDSEDWDRLREFVLASLLSSRQFYPIKLAQLLINDTRRTLAQFSLAIVGKILEHWDFSVGTPILCILADRSPETVSALLDVVLRSRIAVESKFDVIEFCLARPGDHFPFDLVSTTIIYGLKRGGLELLTKIVTQNRELALAILAAGAARLVFLLANIERSRVLVYLKAVRVFLGLVNNLEFGQAALKLGLAVLAKFKGEELEFARNVVAEAVALVRDAAERVGAEKCEHIFRESHDSAAAVRCVADRTRR